jgi:hypothetical protein
MILEVAECWHAEEVGQQHCSSGRKSVGTNFDNIERGPGTDCALIEYFGSEFRISTNSSTTDRACGTENLFSGRVGGFGLRFSPPVSKINQAVTLLLIQSAVHIGISLVCL